MKNWFFQKSKPKEDIEKKDWEKYAIRSHDFQKIFYFNQKTNVRFCLSFMSTLIDESIIQESLLPYLLEKEFKELEDIKIIVPM
ncbi:MAG TPA: spore germination protein, partial [Pseudoneobacillus sp.]|nr:spore germination protein [Pseudoneobacillus sp.]